MSSEPKWSVEHQRWYRIIGPDHNGKFTTTWVDESESVATDNPRNGKRDSATEVDVSGMPPPAPADVRGLISFHGTPERGWVDRLDSRYRVRTMREAHDFFKKGRVFAMLWAETASETLTRNATENTSITVGRFRENVFSQIRRFVVVDVNRGRHFVYACAITTYGDQGALKRGCNASEHTIVYLRGSQPMQIPGERERGMTKEPIMIEPTDASERMKGTSRLRCGKIYSIEWNVKVRDIGMVSGQDKTKLLEYYREEQRQGFDPDSDLNDGEAPHPPRRSHQPQSSYPQHQSYSQQPAYSQQLPYTQQSSYPNPQQSGYYPLQQVPYHPPQPAAYQQSLNGYSQQYLHMESHQPPQNQHPYPYSPQPPYQ